MNLLLDTHVLVWLAQQPDRVPARNRRRLERADRRLVGAPTAYEIAFKTQLGKLPRGQVIIDSWSRVLTSLLVKELPLTTAQAARAGGMSWEHRDPFDRMLVAQAQLDGLVLMTADQRIRDHPDVQTIW